MYHFVPVIRRKIRNFMLGFHDFAFSRSLDRRMRKAARQAGHYNRPVDELVEKRFRELWRPLAGKVCPGWYRYYSGVNGTEDERYVPLSIWFIRIEPVLNNKRFVAAYDDKNACDLLFTDIRKPEVYLRCIDGAFFDRYYTSIEEELVLHSLSGLVSKRPGNGFVMLKPALDSGMGKSILKLPLKDGSLLGPGNIPLTAGSLKKLGGTNFLIQEVVDQHPCTAKLNPDSLNTIRVLTYRSVTDESIIPLHFLQKIGKPGRIIDKGYRVGIGPGGHYHEFCTDSSGTRQTEVNGIRLETLQPLPYMKELSECAVQVAKRCIHSRVLGIDLAIDSSGQVLLIEVNNCFIGVDNIQMNNGPLFGGNTDEVIDYCLKNKKTYSWYFER
jgi:hypothetical protein